MEIIVIDYDAGNIGSVLNAFKYSGFNAVLSSDIHAINKADGIVLPGVGAFDAGIESLRKKDLMEPVKDYILSGRPYLGICLGLQMLFEGSDEGNEQGFSIFPGKVKKFAVPEADTDDLKNKTRSNENSDNDPDKYSISNLNKQYKIPQIGWNTVNIKNTNPILNGISNDDYFYFVHSYYAPYNGEDWAACTTEYITEYVSFLNKNSIFASQFHPEKSQLKGLRIIKNFGNFVKGIG